MSPPEVSSPLRQAGLRVNMPRESMLQWLAERPHATVEQILSGVATARLGVLDEAEAMFWGRCFTCNDKDAIHHEEGRQ